MPSFGSASYLKITFQVGTILFLITWLFFAINLQLLVSSHDKHYSKSWNSHVIKNNNIPAVSHYITSHADKGETTSERSNSRFIFEKSKTLDTTKKKNENVVIQNIKSLKVQQFHHTASFQKKIISTLDSMNASTLKQEQRKQKYSGEAKYGFEKKHKIGIDVDPKKLNKEKKYEDVSNIMKKSKADSTQKQINIAYPLGGSYKSPKILTEGCAVTVLFVDPRIANMPKFSDAWYALESMAVNIQHKTTCVIIQTSHSYPLVNKQIVYENISRNSHPHFSSMIKRGNVRVTFLDTSKYNIRKLNWNVNRVFMHPDYWVDEFLPEDSDLVIILQSDSVFCHKFNVSLWNDINYIGGVWPPEANTHNNPSPPQGACKAIPEFWSRWNSAHDKISVCSDGRAPIGNGGFSLRSRRWMKKIIGLCPSKYATDAASKNCFVAHDYPEDIYFATGMVGHHASMPSAIEASLFGVEMIFLEAVAEYYPSNENITDTVKRRWGGDMVKFNRMRKEGRVIPIGLHKPWLYHSSDIILGDQMKRECPFLEKIVPEKYRTLHEKGISQQLIN